MDANPRTTPCAIATRGVPMSADSAVSVPVPERPLKRRGRPPGSRFVPPPAPDPTPTIHRRRWYSARGLGGILEASPRAFLRAHERGELPGTRINLRGDIRFFGADVLTWLQSGGARKQEPRGEVA